MRSSISEDPSESRYDFMIGSIRDGSIPVIASYDIIFGERQGYVFTPASPVTVFADT